MLNEERLAGLAHEAGSRTNDAPAVSGASEMRWLKAHAAAAYIGISYDHLQKLRERRKGPAYRKFGRCVIYDRVELDAFMSKLRRIEK
jgi:Helix-turn-helix domain